MNNNANDRNDQGNQNSHVRDESKIIRPHTTTDKEFTPDATLPYEDPAVTNPEELASFPKKSEIVDAHEVEKESENRMVNKRTPVREGRNIIRTDNNPENDGFM